MLDCGFVKYIFCEGSILMLRGFRELSLLGVVIEMSLKKMDWYRVLLVFVCETMVNI